MVLVVGNFLVVVEVLSSRKFLLSRKFLSLDSLHPLYQSLNLGPSSLATLVASN
jgi:hypothetical protein